MEIYGRDSREPEPFSYTPNHVILEFGAFEPKVSQRFLNRLRELELPLPPGMRAIAVVRTGRPVREGWYHYGDGV